MGALMGHSSLQSRRCSGGARAEPFSIGRANDQSLNGVTDRRKTKNRDHHHRHHHHHSRCRHRLRSSSLSREPIEGLYDGSARATDVVVSSACQPIRGCQIVRVLNVSDVFGCAKCVSSGTLFFSFAKPTPSYGGGLLPVNCPSSFCNQ